MLESANYDALKLDNQLCFPLYSAAREVMKKYRPYLKEINLTYTQYLTMMVLWDEEDVNVKSLGEELFLDSGTLTPLLKCLESKGYVKRQRNGVDERSVIISLTDKGRDLKQFAVNIPAKVAKSLGLNAEEAQVLYSLLYKILKK